jgi:hypothetical protein
MAASGENHMTVDIAVIAMLKIRVLAVLAR